jgi:hypothetical protein
MPGMPLSYRVEDKMRLSRDKTTRSRARAGVGAADLVE